MDNSIIVAATSLGTVALTSLFAILSKLVDSVQKVNEHELSIRSAYVLKKIEAGQEFVARNNLGIHSAEFFIAFLESYKLYGQTNKDLYESVKQFDDKSVEIGLGANDFTDLYFDMRQKSKDFHSIIIELGPKLNEFSVDSQNGELTKENFKPKLESVIALVRKAKSIREELNEEVRKDLARYDVL